jgi:pimeloyl-ACP methyl ester carboxylesterase
MAKDFTQGWILPAVRMALETTAIAFPPACRYLALRIFSSPRKGRLSPGQAPWLDDARLESIRINNYPTQVYHWPGPGPRVVLLHGWESNSARWEELWRRLQAAGFDLMAIDAPAHGYSGGDRFTAVRYAHCLAEALDRYAPQAIVGHSAGAMAALYCLANLRPNYPLQKLVLVGMPAGLDGLLDAYQRILGVSGRVMQRLNEAAQQRYGFPLPAFFMPPLAASIQVSGLIIHDQNDELAPLTEAQAVHQAWTGSRLMVSRGLGHSTQGPEVWLWVTAFLQETANGAPTMPPPKPLIL